MNSSMRRRRKRSITAGAFLLAVVLTTTACSADQSSNGNSQQNAITEGPVVEHLPEQGGMIEPSVAENDSSAGDKSEDSNSTSCISSDGIFVGLADSHTIEIETPDGPLPLQIKADQLDIVNSLPDDAKGEI